MIEEPRNAPPTQTIILANTKSAGVAAILGFFFGPLGLLYSTIWGALIMFGVNILVALFTFGFGLFLTWPVCAVVGYLAADSYNKRLLANVQNYR